MSFIRSLSNPEGLYIFGSSGGVEIYEKNWWEEDEEGNNGWHIVPYDDWFGIVEAYYDGESVVDADGLTDGETFRFGPFLLEYKKVDNDFKQVLSHEDGWKIEMWDITWQYIVNSTIDTIVRTGGIHESR